MLPAVERACGQVNIFTDMGCRLEADVGEMFQSAPGWCVGLLERPAVTRAQRLMNA
jgi:hypothetical protein